MSFPEAALFPVTAKVNSQGHLSLGGCDLVALASQFGTPLYIYDEATLRFQCREFLSQFRSRYPQTEVIYACKAFINPALARLFLEEGLGLDVVSGGEMAVAQAVSYPGAKLYFHGNNKTPQELAQALEAGVGRVVVDNFYEMCLLNDLDGKAGIRQEILLRISPGVDPHTHTYTTTGVLDSKFGFALETGDASKAVEKAMEAKHLRLVGLHFHLGSPIYETEPFRQGLETVLGFAAQEADSHGLELLELSPGGGFAIQYTREQPPPSVAEYSEVITSTLAGCCRKLGLSLPRLVVEPGRAIVGRAGVSLYRVGARKDIPGLRSYVSIDGGMGDNIRPALYQARYEAVLANKMDQRPVEKVTLAGKFCESGDILIKDITLPSLEAGDLIAVPAAGAYAPSMASTYNMVPRPAIVMVRDGQAQLIRRRETYEDLMRSDHF